MLKNLDHNPNFSFHPTCHRIHLSHLIFTDDIMMFCRGDPKSVQILTSLLSDFSKVSGLSHNPSKCALYVVGTSDLETAALLEITNFQLGTFPFRYLGVPLLSSRLNICHYAPLLEKIEALVSARQSRSLSYAGRLELIRSVVGGSLGFWMALFTFPHSVSSRIEAICRSFLWGKQPGSPYRPLVSWKEVCRPSR